MFGRRSAPIIKIYNNYQNNEHYPFINGEEIVVEGNGDVRSFPFLDSQKSGNIFSDSFSKIQESLIEDLNKLTLEKATAGRFFTPQHRVDDCSCTAYS